MPTTTAVYFDSRGSPSPLSSASRSSPLLVQEQRIAVTCCYTCCSTNTFGDGIFCKRVSLGVVRRFPACEKRTICAGNPLVANSLWFRSQCCSYDDFPESHILLQTRYPSVSNVIPVASCLGSAVCCLWSWWIRTGSAKADERQRETRPTGRRKGG